MKIRHLALLNIILLSNSYQSVFARSNSVPILMAMGSGIPKTSNTFVRLFAMNQEDSVDHWEVKTTDSDKRLEGIRCFQDHNSSLCLMRGDTPSDDSTWSVSLSRDRAKTWVSRPIEGMDAYLDGYSRDAVFSAPFCSGVSTKDFCILGGAYAFWNSDPVPGVYSPFILSSQDGGNSWSLSEIPPHLDGGIIKTLTCNHRGPSSVCVAVGQKGDAWGSQPVLLVSDDQGLTWVTPKVTQLPADGALSDVACTDSATGTRCIAVGVTGDNEHQIPIFIVSQDGGRNWQVPKNLQLPEISTYGAVPFPSISCSPKGASATCAIALSATDGTVLISSQNGGADWLSEQIKGGESSSPVTCSGNVCALGGQLGKEMKTAIWVSKDSGKTWNQKLAPSLSSPGGQGHFRISCTGEAETSVCIAASRSSKNRNWPAMLISKDQGDHWNEIPLSFPSSLKEAFFDETSATRNF